MVERGPVRHRATPPLGGLEDIISSALRAGELRHVQRPGAEEFCRRFSPCHGHGRSVRVVPCSPRLVSVSQPVGEDCSGWVIVAGVRLGPAVSTRSVIRGSGLTWRHP